MTEMGFDIGKAKASRRREGFIPNPKLKLLEQVSEGMRFKHYSLRTERTYQEWIKRHPKPKCDIKATPKRVESQGTNKATPKPPKGQPEGATLRLRPASQW